MSALERQEVQGRFESGVTRVVVATVAFSMGIDKSDIGAVIHFDLPKSFESYVQEIGRAGRNGNQARCYVFVEQDSYFTLRNMMLVNYFDSETLRGILMHVRKQVEEAPDDTDYLYLNSKELCGDFNLRHEVLITLFTYLGYIAPTAATYMLDMPQKIILRFYSGQWESKAGEGTLLGYMKEDWKKYGGNYHVDVAVLCRNQKVFKPYDIMRELYVLQGESILGYEAVSKSQAFVLEIGDDFKTTFTGQRRIRDLAEELGKRLNRVEHLQIEKLRAFYSVCDLIALRPKVSHKMLMNKFIDLYYRADLLEEFNLEVANQEEDGGVYLPMLDVDEDVKEKIQSDVRSIFNDDEQFPPLAVQMKQVFLGVWQDWRKDGGDARYTLWNKKYEEYEYSGVMGAIDEEVERQTDSRRLREVLEE